MAAHCSILAWRILWTEEPGGLQSTGLHRVGDVWTTEHSLVQTSFRAWPCPQWPGERAASARLSAPLLPPGAGGPDPSPELVLGMGAKQGPLRPGCPGRRRSSAITAMLLWKVVSPPLLRWWGL